MAMGFQNIGVRAIVEGLGAYMSDLKQVSGATQTAGSKITGIGKGMQSAGAGLTAGLTLPIVGLGFAAVTSGLQFEKGFAEIRSLMPTASDFQMDKLRDDVIGFSKEMGFATTEAIPALYQAISAGIPADNAIEFMKVAGKAAIGGVTDLETAVDGISSVMNAYGADIISAGEASDLMFTAVKFGKTTFEELSASLFNVVPTAAAMGVSFEDVTAALAAMTAQGVPTSVATTQLRQLFVELGKSGTKTADAFEEVAGQSFTKFIATGGNVAEALDLMSEIAGPKVINVMRELQTEGSNLSKVFAEKAGMSLQAFVKTGGTLTDALDIISEEAGVTGSSMTDLFGSVEAANAAMTLTSGPAFKQFLDEAANSAGATNDAFKIMDDTVGRDLQKAMNEMKITLMELGVALLPTLAEVIKAMLPVIRAFAKGVKIFSDLPGPVKTLIIAFVALLAALGPILLIVGTIVSAVGTLITAFGAIGGVLAVAGTAFAPLIAVALPVLAVVAAIAALALAAYLIYKNWGAISAFFSDLWVKVKGIFGDAVEFVKGIVGDMWEFVKGSFDDAIGWVGQTAGKFKDAVVGVFEDAFNGVKDFLKSNWREIVGLLGGPFMMFALDSFGIRSKIVGFVTDIFNSVVAFLTGNWREILGVLGGPFMMFALDSFGIRSKIIKFVKGLARDSVKAVVNMAKLIVSQFQKMSVSLLTIIKDLVVGVVKFWVLLPIRMIAAFKDGVVTVVKLAVDLFTGIIAAFKNGVVTVVKLAVDLFTGIIAAFKNGVTTVVSVVTGMATQVVSIFVALPGRIASSLSSLTSSVVAVFTSMGTSLATTVGGIISNIVSFFTGLPGKIVTALGNLVGTMGSIGSDIMQALLNGISGAFGGASGLANTIANAIIDSINSILSVLGTAVSWLKEALDKIPGPNPAGNMLQELADYLKGSPIPHLAVGTRKALGGLSIVGEHGPEVMMVPSMARVFQHQDTRGVIEAFTGANLAQRLTAMPSPGQSYSAGANVTVPINVSVQQLDWAQIRSAIHQAIDSSLGANRVSTINAGVSLGSGIG